MPPKPKSRQSWMSVRHPLVSNRWSRATPKNRKLPSRVDNLVVHGGSGSGNFGHGGRPGEVGGSGAAISAAQRIVGKQIVAKLKKHGVQIVESKRPDVAEHGGAAYLKYQGVVGVSKSVTNPHIVVHEIGHAVDAAMHSNTPISQRTFDQHGYWSEKSLTKSLAADRQSATPKTPGPSWENKAQSWSYAFSSPQEAFAHIFGAIHGDDTKINGHSIKDAMPKTYQLVEKQVKRLTTNMVANARKSPLKLDPSRTAGIRRRFCTVVRGLFNRLKTKVVQLVVTEDAFGLNIGNHLTANTRFAFHSTQEQVEAFRLWLQSQINAGILFQNTQRELDKFWDDYIQEGFRLGQGRAWDSVQKRGMYQEGSVADFYAHSKQQFLRSAFANPVGVEKVKVLAGRVYTELKGVTDVMSQRMTRALTDGLVQGKSPREVARDINKQVDGIGRTRALAIARTETIRAHAEGQLDAMEELGVQEVNVAVEWSTAEDELVCPECEEMEGVVLSIDDAHNMIPRHPNCFVSPHVLIYTANGWRPLGSIRVGDLVLTHKGRFRAVTQLHRNSGAGRVVEFQIGWGGNMHKVAVTEDHPVMVNKMWVAVKHVKVGDKVRWLAASCQGCGRSIPFGLKYCDQVCQWKNAEHRTNVAQKNRDANLRQYASGERDRSTVMTEAHSRIRELITNGQFDHARPSGEANAAKRPEVREKIRVGKLGDLNPMRIHPEIGRANGLQLAEYIRKNPHQHANAVVARRGYRTWIERWMGAALDRLGIIAEYNHYVEGKWIDWAIVGSKLAIECDGEHWHKDKDKDAQRDAFLAGHGWTVLRFTGKEIKANADDCAARVARVLANHDGAFRFSAFSVVAVRSYHKQHLRMYNLSVEEDESYVAKGCAVHNCRCAFLPANVGESQENQTRGKRNVVEAIHASVLAEGGKGTLQDKLDSSSWGGATVDITGTPTSLVTHSHVNYDVIKGLYDTDVATMTFGEYAESLPKPLMFKDDPLYDVINGLVTHGGPGSGPHPGQPELHPAVVEMLKAAMRRVEPGADRGALVGAKALREELGMPKSAFDELMVKAGQEFHVSLHRHDAPAHLSDEKRGELIHAPEHDDYGHSGTQLKGTFYVGAAIRQSPTTHGEAGSGNFGHAGRPGEVGGSGEGGTAESHIPLPSMADLLPVKDLPGSTHPKLMENAEDGKQYVVKDTQYVKLEHLQSEALADSIYRSLGVAVPNSGMVPGVTGPSKVSAFLEGAKTLAEWSQGKSAAEKEAMHAEISKGFVADALLANWDVIGLGKDNIMIHNGIPVRIDNGGALTYRAQGGLKGAAFGAKVGELESMRNAAMNKTSAEVFGKLTPGQISKQIDTVVGHREGVLAKIHDPQLKAIMESRFDYLSNLQKNPLTTTPPKVESPATGHVSSVSQGHGLTSGASLVAHIESHAGTAKFTPLAMVKVQHLNPDGIKNGAVKVPAGMVQNPAKLDALKAMLPPGTTVQKVSGLSAEKIGLKSAGEKPVAVSKPEVAQIKQAMSTSTGQSGQPVKMNAAGQIVLHTSKPLSESEHAAWANKCTSNQLEAVMKWTNGLNGEMRKAFYTGKSTENIKSLNQQLLGALEKGGNYQGTIYRNVGDYTTEKGGLNISQVFKTLGVGGVWHDVAPHGGSRSPTGYGPAKPVLMQIVTKTGTAIEKHSHYGSESEVIQRPGTQYRITNIIENKTIKGPGGKYDKHMIVHLEEI